MSTVTTNILTRIKYPRLPNVHGYQISTVTEDSCCGLRGQTYVTEFLCWRNTTGAYDLWIAFGLLLHVFKPYVISLQPSRLPQNS